MQNKESHDAVQGQAELSADLCDFFVPAQQCTLRIGHEGIHRSIDVFQQEPADFCAFAGDFSALPADTPNALAPDAEPSAGRHHGMFGFDQPEPSTPPNLERLAREAAEKVVNWYAGILETPVRQSEIKVVSDFILSTLQGTDLFVAGAEAAAKVVEQPFQSMAHSEEEQWRVRLVNQLAREIRALVPTGREEVEAWQPIETAPKDGTLIIVGLIDDGHIHRVGDARFRRIGWYSENGTACHWVTHWMPLPASPSTTPKDSGVEEKNQG